MIQHDFFIAFDNEVAQVATEIAETKRNLDAEEGRDTAGELRIRITYLGKLLESLKAGAAAIRTADARVAEMQKRYARWYALASKAREAEAEVLELHELVAPACEAYDAALAVSRNAELEWQGELQVQLDRLATEPEKARKRALEAELRAEYERTLADMREAGQRRDLARKAVFDARIRLDQAQFQESINRVPDDGAAGSGKSWAA